MNWLVLFIFLVAISCTFSLQCRTTGDEEPITLAFAEFSITDLYNEINDLELTKCISFDDESDCLCRIEVFIDPESNEITMKFTDILFGNNPPEEVIRIDTVINAFDKTDITAVHYLEYACSFEGCEEIYLNESQHLLNWFIENDLVDLTNEVILYAFGDDEEVTEIEECYTSENSTWECMTQNCAAQLSRQYQEDEIEQGCIDNEFIGIYYTSYYDLQTRDNQESLTLTCNYSHCNEKSIFEHMISKFDVYYQINDVLNTIKSYKRSEELETITTTTATTTLTSTTTTMTTTTTTLKSTITTTTATTTIQSTTTTTTTTTLNSTIKEATSLKTTTTTNPQGNSGFKYTIHMTIFYISLIRFVLIY